MSLIITRKIKTDKVTIGDGVAMNKYYFKTLELPWNNNQKRISCIPEGTYKVVAHVSPKFGKCFHVLNVPNRSEILIHPANMVSQLLGCIAPGTATADINGDGILDVTNSRAAMAELLNLLPKEFDLIIKS